MIFPSSATLCLAFGMMCKTLVTLGNDYVCLVIGLGDRAYFLACCSNRLSTPKLCRPRWRYRTLVTVLYLPTPSIRHHWYSALPLHFSWTERHVHGQTAALKNTDRMWHKEMVSEKKWRHSSIRKLAYTELSLPAETWSHWTAITWQVCFSSPGATLHL